MRSEAVDVSGNQYGAGAMARAIRRQRLTDRGRCCSTEVCGAP